MPPKDPFEDVLDTFDTIDRSHNSRSITTEIARHHIFTTAAAAQAQCQNMGLHPDQHESISTVLALLSLAKVARIELRDIHDRACANATKPGDAIVENYISIGVTHVRDIITPLCVPPVDVSDKLPLSVMLDARRIMRSTNKQSTIFTCNCADHYCKQKHNGIVATLQDLEHSIISMTEQAHSISTHA